MPALGELTFQCLGEPEHRIYAAWFSDHQTAARIAYPDEQWYRYVAREPGVYAWLIYDHDRPVGQIQLDMEADRSASMSFVINPALRRHGYCKRILAALLTRPEVRSLTHIAAWVEPDNAGSRRC